MFIGYDMFRNLAQGKHMKRKVQREEFQKFLLDPGALGEGGEYSGTQASEIWTPVPVLDVPHLTSQFVF